MSPRNCNVKARKTTHHHLSAKHIPRAQQTSIIINRWVLRLLLCYSHHHNTFTVTTVTVRAAMTGESEKAGSKGGERNSFTHERKLWPVTVATNPLSRDFFQVVYWWFWPWSDDPIVPSLSVAIRSWCSRAFLLQKKTFKKPLSRLSYHKGHE